MPLLYPCVDVKPLERPRNADKWDIKGGKSGKEHRKRLRGGGGVKGETGGHSDVALQSFLDKTQQQRQHMLTFPNCLAFILSSYLLQAWIDPLEAAHKPRPWGKEDKRPRASHLTYQERTAKPVLDYKNRGIVDGEREKKRERRAHALKGKWGGKLMQRNAGCRMCVRRESSSLTVSQLVQLRRAAPILFKPPASSSDHYRPRSETWTF